MSKIRWALVLSSVAVACGSNSASTGLATTSGGAGGTGNNQAAGGSSGGTGSGTASMPDVSSICGGLFGVHHACGYESFDIASVSVKDAAAQPNCEFALTGSLLAVDVPVTAVALDCSLVPGIPNNDPDAGVSGGFVIEFAQSPPNLRFLGSFCSAVQVSGSHHIDVVVICDKA